MRSLSIGSVCNTFLRESICRKATNMGNSTTFYQGITNLPRHIEERLLMFNVLQLCALVCEKPGTKWSGASDVYGPIQEIAKRWDLGALTKRIEDMQPEQPLLTYARVMTALGGNPAREGEIAKKEAAIRAPFEKYTKQVEPDAIAKGLAGCLTLEDLQRVAKEQDLGTIDWAKVDGLKNFGLKRMWVGNRWRFINRQRSKT